MPTPRASRFCLQVQTPAISARWQAQAVLHVAQQTFDTRQLLLDQVTCVGHQQTAVRTGREFCAGRRCRKASCCWKKPKTTPMPRWPRSPRRWAIANSTQFQLVEQSPTVNAATNDDFRSGPDGAGKRPELLSLRNERDAALRFAKSQRDSRLPTIAAVGVAGDSPTHDSHLPDNYAAGGIQLSLPLFAGGLLHRAPA